MLKKAILSILVLITLFLAVFISYSKNGIQHLYPLRINLSFAMMF